MNPGPLNPNTSALIIYSWWKNYLILDITNYLIALGFSVGLNSGGVFVNEGNGFVHIAVEARLPPGRALLNVSFLTTSHTHIYKLQLDKNYNLKVLVSI